MGIEFNDNGIIRNLTVADMLTDEFRETYYDLYKGLNGIKPRWETSPEVMLHFFDTYEEQYAAEREREAAELAALSQQDGIEYRNWSHFYDEKERRDEEAYQREAEAKASKRDYLARVAARFSPLAAIREWEYGAI